MKDEDQFPAAARPASAPAEPASAPPEPASAPPEPAFAPPGSAPAPLQWPQVYYSLTLVFALIDWTLGANVRAVGLDNAPGMRAGYYGLCLLCAVFIHYRPEWAAPVTLLDSSLNVGVLILSVFVAYYGMVDTIEGPEPFVNPINGRFMLNFLISGGVGTVVFYQSLYAVGGRGSYWPGGGDLAT